MTDQLNHNEVEERKRQKERCVDYGLLILLILPNLAWVLLDKGMWVSDACFYALDSLKLHQAWRLGISEWWINMLSVQPKPPVLPWIGQLFVPVGEWMGNIDSGLLLINIIALYITLILLYRVFIQHFKDRRFALLGCLIIAATPISSGISRQFYVQTIQLTVVTWFLYIMVNSRRWDSIYTVLQLISASSASFLTMLSTPMLCLLPGTMAFWHALRKFKTSHITFKIKHALWLSIAITVSVLCIMWYLKNYSQAAEYARFGFSYIYSGYIGASYFERLAIWIFYVLLGLFVPWIAFNVILIFVFVLFSFLNIQVKGSSAVNIEFKSLLLQVILSLAIFSLSVQQEIRYVLPLISYISLITIWLLFKMKNERVFVLMTILFFCQWIVVNLGSFGVIDVRGPLTRIIQYQQDHRQYLIDNIVKLSATMGSHNVLLALNGLNFYSLEVQYSQAKKSVDYAKNGSVHYDCIEFLLTRPNIKGNIEQAWAEILKTRPATIIIMNATLREASYVKDINTSRHKEGWALLINNAIDLSSKIPDSLLYQKIEWPECPELEAYRYIGSHDQADVTNS